MRLTIGNVTSEKQTRRNMKKYDSLHDLEAEQTSSNIVLFHSGHSHQTEVAVLHFHVNYSSVHWSI